MDNSVATADKDGPRFIHPLRRQLIHTGEINELNADHLHALDLLEESLEQMVEAHEKFKTYNWVQRLIHNALRWIK